MKERERLGFEIKEKLTELRRDQGWNIDLLANYLEINSMTLRNSLHRGYWSDLVVTILKLKNAIPEKLAYDYQAALAKEKIEERKLMAKKGKGKKMSETSELVEVESSTIKSVRLVHDLTEEDQLNLEVHFKRGAAYLYFGISEELYHRFLDSESKMKFLKSEIEPKFPFVKLDGSEKKSA